MFCKEASSGLQTLNIAKSLSSEFTKPSALINPLSVGHRYKLCPRPNLRGRCTVTASKFDFDWITKERVKKIKVKGIITAKQGLLPSVGFTDLLGISLLVELISAETDPRHRYKLCPRPNLRGRCTVTASKFDINGKGKIVKEEVKKIKVKGTITVLSQEKKKKGTITAQEGLLPSVGESLLVELISAETDPRTPIEKDPVEDYAQRVLIDGHDDQYQCVFDMPKDFGAVGAIRVVNLESKEIFLKEMKLEVPDGPVTFTFNSWVAPKSEDPTKRTFFSNKSYLPLQTPEPLKQLRKEELETLQGKNRERDGELKKFERVYDYDVYNDVGDPDKDPKLARPVLGGLSHPYPRRCKTGRKPCDKDPSTETRHGEFYVPRDEEFSTVKGDAFTGTLALAALPAALPQIEACLLDPNMPFPHFKSIENLFEEGIEIPKDTGLLFLIPRIFKAIAEAEDILLFESPILLDKDRFSWIRDNEFARQTLAGLNPYCIQLVREWPLKSKLDPAIYGDPNSLITSEIVEREIKGVMSFDEALENKRLFMLDYHDLLLPYVNKVRELDDSTLYASRTLFFLNDDSTLRPVAIELTRPQDKTRPQWRHVFTPGYDATSCWLWSLAKTHAITHDAGYHQLISHCKLDPAVYGDPNSLITSEIVEREIKGVMSFDEALENKRLFMLDYHDLLLPYVNRVRELDDSTLYASRALFFLSDDSTLRPVAIELTRPQDVNKPQWRQVFTPGYDATSCWLWSLAKTHAISHDAGYHQLISHWLRTHCCMEPYIIAANRQLSAMHPIYRLLHPHFRYTMEINARARQSLVNAGGIIESCFWPGKYSLELSSDVYDKLWRFDREGLPADLISRGLAVEDETAEHGVRLTVPDYPFANDGLMLWDALKEWVTDYVNHYYPDAEQVKLDEELQGWWSEVRNIGHGDKKNEPWWPVLKTQDDLIEVVTTIAWVASGHHAAVNFGQYGKLDPAIYGDPNSLITSEIVEREIKGVMSFDEALENKRLFMLDYHDLLLPYVNKVRELDDSTLYASRTLFFLNDDSTLRPVAIELTRPQDKTRPQWRHVFTPGYDATSCWLWTLAKTHAISHDAGYHQLISHWLRTHCSMEPYIIAANRQLSAMHPIYRLLHPHFRYTMEINARARQSLVNAGGIIESCFWPGKYSLELSSDVYDKLWRFDREGLPADLISRGLAVEDETAEHGLRLTIPDYPFANDGLMLWDALKEWVTDYVKHYYPDAEQVRSDEELKEWWNEVKNIGHGDKKNEPWWPDLKTQDDLIEVVTTIAWVASGHHAAVNFGQYGYGGYFPNRPTTSRIKMPVEEPYLGENPEASWAHEPIIYAAYERFKGKLQYLEGVIDERNVNVSLKNRTGAGVVKYELLKPISEPGVTGMGVPYSVSI
ncbi:hypothetical protein F2Q68_00045841 [Brassica cretica]|uniref:Lipoxygenase n=1 Tax=Brassica cretica TaxID=69181 RepID=A0A8S9LCJ6_BRACR|nr:hypothetical protein F2Q68_00045841 [Brassica cretica]